MKTMDKQNLKIPEGMVLIKQTFDAKVVQNYDRFHGAYGAKLRGRGLHGIHQLGDSLSFGHKIFRFRKFLMPRLTANERL